MDTDWVDTNLDLNFRGCCMPRGSGYTGKGE